MANYNFTSIDPAVSVSVAPASVTEAGSTNLVYTFSREGDASKALSFNIELAGTADSVDYITLPPLASALKPAHIWTQLLGSSAQDYARSLTTGLDGAIYMAGHTRGALYGQSNKGQDDGFLSKYSINGTKLWTQLLGTSGNEFINAVATGRDGSIYVTGTTAGLLDGQTSRGEYETFLTKYTGDGTKVWTRLIGAEGWDKAYGLTEGLDGSVYIAGDAQGSFDGLPRLGMQSGFLVKYSADGVKTWVRLNGAAQGESSVAALTTGLDGSLYMSGWIKNGALEGNTYSGALNYDAFLVKYDTSGQKLWAKQVPMYSTPNTKGSLFFDALVTGLDGSIYVGAKGGAFAEGSSTQVMDYYIYKYGTGGELVWSRAVGLNGNNYLNEDVNFGVTLTLGADGSIYIGGHTKDSLTGEANKGQTDAFVAKFNTDGTKVWSKLLGSSGDDVALDLSTGLDGSIYVSGWTTGSIDGRANSGGRDAFIAKLSVDAPTISFAPGSSTATLTVDPTADSRIEGNETVSVAVKPGAGYSEGLAAVAVGTLTEPQDDTTAPTASTFSPADEATAVAVGANVVVTFSEPIQRGAGNIVLKKADGTTLATYAQSSTEVTVSSSTLTINPAADLSYSNSYKVEFAAGSVQDLAGNNYAGTTSYNFTTGAAPANHAPVLDASKAPALTSIIQGGSAPAPGNTSGASLVSGLIASAAPLANYSDADRDLPGIAITSVNPNGMLYFSTDAGSTWANVGSVSVGSARLLYADAHTWLRFVPDASFKGELTDALSFKAWDRTGGYSNGQAGVNATDKVSVQPLSTYVTSVDTRAVAVSSQYALISAYGNGATVELIDISKPDAPVKVGVYQTTGTANGMDIRGNTAYLACDYDGLVMVDISNPSAPTRLGSFNTSGNAYDVTVRGHLAYVADYFAGLQIIDVSNPASPILLGTSDTSGYANAVALSGNYAYVADYYNGLAVIDVSNPAAPVVVAGLDTPGVAYGVTVSGRYAFVADTSAGLQVIDIATPASPKLVSNYQAGGRATLVGETLYVPSARELLVLDVSEPSAPQLTQRIDTVGYATDLSVLGSNIYVAAGNSGLKVFQESNANAFSHARDTASLTVATAPAKAVYGTVHAQLAYSGDTPVIYELWSQRSDVPFQNETWNEGRLIVRENSGKASIRISDYSSNHIHFDIQAGAVLEASAITVDVTGWIEPWLGFWFDYELTDGAFKVTDSGAGRNIPASNVVVRADAVPPYLPPGSNTLPTGGVSISGTAAANSLLNASNDIFDADGVSNLAYQWHLGDTPITGATSASLIVPQGSEDQWISVWVQYTDGAGKVERLRSELVMGLKSNSPPVLSAPTAITYTDTAGNDTFANQTGILSATDTDKDALTYGVSGGTVADGSSLKQGTYGSLNVNTITGAYTFAPNDAAIEGIKANTSESFTVTVADSKATANATLIVNLKGANDAPSGTVAIGGNATQGQTLTASNTLADLEGIPSSGAGAVAYQWQAGGVPINGATSTTLTLTQAQVGKVISVKAGYTDLQGTAESVTSSATTAVAPLAAVAAAAVYKGHLYTTVDGPTWEGAEAKANALGGHLVTINDAQEAAWIRENFVQGYGKALWIGLSDQAQEGQWVWSSGEKSTYRDWFRDNAWVAPNNYWSLGEDFAVIGWDAWGWQDVGYSPDQSGGIPALRGIVEITPVVSITGTATQGQVLTTVNSSTNVGLIASSGAGQVAYQWKASGVNITGATLSAYTLTQAEVGKAITVTASFTDKQGMAESVTSTPTAAVVNVDDAATGNLLVSGSAKEGATLSANLSNLLDADGSPTVAWQWQEQGSNGSWTNLANKTLANLIIPSDLSYVGKVLRVVATTTDPLGGKTVFNGPASSAIVSAAPVYSLSSDVKTVNEGAAVKFTLATQNVASGTTLTYSLSGTGISSGDVDGGSLSGTIKTDATGKASLAVSLLADKTHRRRRDAELCGGGQTQLAVKVNDTSTATVTAAPGVVFTDATNLSTSEAGGRAQFKVALASAPRYDVTVTLTSNDQTEGLFVSAATSGVQSDQRDQGAHLHGQQLEPSANGEPDWGGRQRDRWGCVVCDQHQGELERLELRRHAGSGKGWWWPTCL
jgi:methionine-rich copper-binding protein CopC